MDANDSFYEDDEAFLEAAKQIIETKKPDPRIVATKPKTPEDSFYNDDDFCEIIKEVVAEKKPPEDSFYDDDEAFLEAAKQAIEAKKPGPSTVASEPKTPEDSFYKNDSVFIEAAKQLNTVVAKAEPKTPGDSFYEDDVAFLEAAKQAIKSEPTGDTNVLLEDIPLPSSTNVPSWFQPNEHSTPLVGQVSNDSGNISLDLSVNFTPAPPVKKRKRLGMH